MDSTPHLRYTGPVSFLNHGHTGFRTPQPPGYKLLSSYSTSELIGSTVLQHLPLGHVNVN